METRSTVILEQNNGNLLQQTVKNISFQPDNTNETHEFSSRTTASQDPQSEHELSETILNTCQKSEILRNLENLCRICANSQIQMVPIFSSEGAQRNLSSKVDKYLPIQVSENDTLPTQLCYQCATLILSWDELFEGCLKAQQKLYQLHVATQTKQTEESGNQISEADEDEEIEKHDVISTESEANETPFFDGEEGNKEEEKKHDVSTSTNTQSLDSTNQQNDIFLDFQKSYKEFLVSPIMLEKNWTQRITGQPYSRNSKKCSSSTKKESNPRKSRQNHDDDTEIFFQCQKCDERSTSISDYKIHCESHNNTGEKICTKKKVTCHICGNQYKNSSGLDAHFRRMHAVKKYSCDICGKLYGIEHEMVDHRRSHTGERPFSCDSCGKSFRTRNLLLAHMKRHLNKLPFQCTFCEKSFNQNEQLLLHLTLHTCEKKYQCDICGKSFDRNQNLNKHKRTHSLQKTFICDVCGISFGQERYLTYHKNFKHRTWDFNDKL